MMNRYSYGGELHHYGVLGMKWGVRKKVERSTSTRQKTTSSPIADIQSRIKYPKGGQSTNSPTISKVEQFRSNGVRRGNAEKSFMQGRDELIDRGAAVRYCNIMASSFSPIYGGPGVHQSYMIYNPKNGKTEVAQIRLNSSDSKDLPFESARYSISIYSPGSGNIAEFEVDPDNVEDVLDDIKETYFEDEDIDEDKVDEFNKERDELEKQMKDAENEQDDRDQMSRAIKKATSSGNKNLSRILKNKQRYDEEKRQAEEASKKLLKSASVDWKKR